MVACFCSLWGFNPTSYYFILVLVLRDLLIGWRRCFGSPEGFTASRSRWGQCFGGQILWVDRVMTLKSCKWDDSCSWGYIYNYMLRYCPFSCTCRLTSCSATVRSLALVHTHIMLFYCTFACTQTCDLLPAHTNKDWGWVGWGNNVHLCAHRSCYAEDVLVSVTSCME